ncbi:YhjD/YihY/BrkB family envelope integrity protein [Kocuria rhizophila]|nr:YhjD/YihY/BrkB family envelope integrity protein [Kocuria rhizophila]
MTLFLLVLLIAILFYATPNVQQPKFESDKPGCGIALVFMIIRASATAFSSPTSRPYNATYGVIGSVIILLLGLWIMNNALLFGAEVDAELERGRQLQGGIVAKHTIQLPAGHHQVKKLRAKEEKLEAEGRKSGCTPSTSTLPRS